MTLARYEQLQDHLRALRKDSEKLKALVTKYYTIHDEGPGRRFLFTIKESSGLTDLRRRIGLHEQMLQIWYMTLVYGSLRRLEGGQEGILRAIEAIKNWTPQKKQSVKRSLHRGDSRPLERELRNCGLEPEAVEAALGTAVDYMEAPPVEQVRMESKARSSLTTRPEGKPISKMSPDEHGFGSSEKPRFVFNEPNGLMATPDLRRSKSASARRPGPSLDQDEGTGVTSHRNEEEVYELIRAMEKTRLEREPREVHRERSRQREKIYPSSDEDIITILNDSTRPRRSSSPLKRPPRNPLLVVPDTGPRYRSASSHSVEHRVERPKPDTGSSVEQVLFIQETPRLHRSSSQRSDRSNKERRDPSTHSYTRRRSLSRGRQGGEETVEWVRMVNKMDRIDSIPI